MVYSLLFDIFCSKRNSIFFSVGFLIGYFAGLQDKHNQVQNFKIIGSLLPHDLVWSPSACILLFALSLSSLLQFLFPYYKYIENKKG